MVNITNGQVDLTVTRGAFKSYYQRCGFRLREATEEHESDVPQDFTQIENTANLAHESASEDVPDEEPEAVESEEGEVDYSEIPLSELNFEQLCKYADQLGLDHDGVKTAKGMRALIKANL